MTTVDWTATLPTTAHLTVLDDLLNRDIENAVKDYQSGIHVPDRTIRVSRAGGFFTLEEYDNPTNTWTASAISVAGGGTGATTAAGARTALGLGTMAVQDASAVAISGGTVAASLAGSTNVPAAGISGVIPPANLGTGSVGAGALFLADDSTYKQVVPPGVINLYGGAAAPTGYVLCDGSSYLRAGTMAALFAIIGTTYGAADGTHFNVPDLRQRFPLGKAAAGTGNALGATGGSIDHTHTLSAHTHTIAHTHNMGNHTHTISHAHSMQGHTHGIGAEALTAASPASGSFVDVAAGVSFTVTTATHAHAIGAHSHGGATGGPSTANTGGTDTASSGGPSTNVSDGSNTASSGAPSIDATSAVNPPFIALNYIIKF